MSSHLYVLDDDGNPVQEPDVIKWATWYEKNDARRIVEQTLFQCCGQLLSTVFLGIDHNFAASGPPTLYETMAFDGGADQWQDRYSTREQAQEGHRLGVEAHTCD